jgi:hypothetical protein
MMNYIYSVFKRSNTGGSNGFGSTFFMKYVIITVFSYVFVTFTSLIYIEQFLFENRNTAFEFFIVLSCAFIVIYPFFYALIPGYTYLDSVQKYSTVKAIVISCLIAITPTLLSIVIIYSL